jgi:hypothetical protein
MSSAGRYRLGRRGLLSAAVAVLACVVVAAPVSAFVSRATHITIVPDTIVPDLPPPTYGSYWVNFGSSTATCPTGQHVLFGGFKWGMSGMRRTASNRWTVYGWNFSIFLEGANNSPLSMSSRAYCGYGPVPSKATSTVVIRYRSDRESGSATARCPEGTVVVAGGFATTPNTVVAVTGLERVAADLWRVSAYIPVDITRHAALTSIAYCGPGPAPKLVSRTIRTLTDGPAFATCPVGKHLAFGGAIVKGSNPSLETLRARTQRTWSVGGYGEKLTALAYCR